MSEQKINLLEQQITVLQKDREQLLQEIGGQFAKVYMMVEQIAQNMQVLHTRLEALEVKAGIPTAPIKEKKDTGIEL